MCCALWCTLGSPSTSTALLTVSRTISGNSTALKIFPHREFSAIKQRRNALISQNLHQQYYVKLCTKLSSNHGEALNASYRYTEHNRTEHLVLEELETYSSRSRLMLFVDIDELINKTSCTLLRPLREILTTAEIWRGTETPAVYVQELYYLRALCKLVQTQGDASMHDYVSWFTVHTLAPLASPDLATMYYGSARRKAEAAKQCLRLTEQCLGWATYQRYYARFSTMNARKIERDVIEDIKEAQNRLVTGSSWLQTAAVGLVERLRATGVRLAVPVERDAYMDDAFSSLAVTGVGFASNWGKAARFTRHLPSATRAVVECAFVATSEQALFADFDAARQEVLVAPYAETLPVFDASVPHAVRYGAFGTAVAQALLEAFLEALSERRELGSALSGHEHCYLDLSAVYSRREHNVATFLALEATWAAYSALAEEQTMETRLTLLEGFTERQLFFLAHCYLCCGSSPEKAEAQCNGPLKNSVAFATTFNCPSGSEMNPKQKCNFYG
ncbi:neprilysin-1-like [Dermacentor silvarum]|uniref:neprilysin-1-like n=1 Tax=Dermacentor silvarum TaxID=543639 RepID=UPI00189B676F|nr:neprilysin-1-like [Dermacentor silvarum]